MVEAKLEIIDDFNDFQMVRTAWFTSLIMNSSGNYKRPIKPDRLYQSKYTNGTGTSKKKTKAQVEAEKERLRDLFNIRDR